MAMILTICDTCKRADWDAETASQSDGEALADLVRAAVAGHPDITLRTHSCLMGCDYGCNLTLQDGTGAPKIAYALGQFTPTAEAAEAIVEFATLYDQSATGQVPYRTWPQGVKGHFRARIPALPTDTPPDLGK